MERKRISVLSCREGEREWGRSEVVEKKEEKDERKKGVGARKEGRTEKPNLEDEDKMWAINDYIITDWHR